MRVTVTGRAVLVHAKYINNNKKSQKTVLHKPTERQFYAVSNLAIFGTGAKPILHETAL